MPRLSKSNVNVTAAAELTNARLSVAPITHRANKFPIATSLPAATSGALSFDFIRSRDGHTPVKAAATQLDL
jgi:hypothetical protein